MIHPATSLQYINDEIGYGVFATDFIPKGTITYVKDPLEIEIQPELFERYSSLMKEVIEKYSYRDEEGVRILSWDFGKYVNHCCNCNTMSTGYGFEIAIRDIQAGEEITDEYGLFNIEGEMTLNCKQPGCRLTVSSTDIQTYHQEWDKKVIAALSAIYQHDQPLLNLINKKTRVELDYYLFHHGDYRSVLTLQLEGKKTRKFIF